MNASRWEAIVAGVVIAVALVGVTLQLVLLPSVTRTIAGFGDVSERTGLAESDALGLAEDVRLYVVGGLEGSLPTSAYGRDAFDRAAVDHLDDVRSAIRGATLVSWVLVLGIAAWVGRCAYRRRLSVLSSALRVAGWVALGIPIVAALAGLADFDTLFAGFHGVLFQAGTWQFDADELLIQLFPQTFWMTAAALWGGLLALYGAALLVGSRFVRRRTGA